MMGGVEEFHISAKMLLFRLVLIFVMPWQVTEDKKKEVNVQSFFILHIV